MSKSLKNKMRIFSESLFTTLLLSICAIIAVYFIADADNKTRSIGFGDNEPAVYVYIEDESIEMGMFGKEVDLQYNKFDDTLTSAKNIGVTCVSPILRLIAIGAQYVKDSMK